MVLVKLALGNVCRGVRDFSVYFLTLALAACLLYSFLASTDYLLELDLTADQRLAYAQAGQVLSAFSVLAVVVFAFLIGYANVFIVRRRKREFGLLELMGMGRPQVASVLLTESGAVGAASLAAGVFAGVVLSPVFSLVAAFVFGVSGRPVIAFSASAAFQCALSFLAISLIAALHAVRSVEKCSLVELMRTERAPEARLLAGRVAVRAQGAGAAALLACVWGCCLLSPGYFIVFIIPMGFVALGGTYLLFRVLAVRLPDRMRTRPERYFAGLVPFDVRSLEARAETGCAASAATCVLLAAGMCMLLAGLVFSVGFRLGGDLGTVELLAPVAYAAMFYGVCFLVSASAVLALQQLSQASDARAAYQSLYRLGVGRDLALRSCRIQVGVAFLAPTAMACVHCLFGFALIGIISIMMGSAGYLMLVAATLAGTLALLAAYYALTVHASARSLVPWR